MSSDQVHRRLKAVVLGNDQSRVNETLAAIRPVILARADIVLEDLKNQVDLSRAEADVAIVFGGDGSILRAAKQMGVNQIPVLGVNLGRLGFLAALSIDELASVLDEVCQGRYAVIDHLMFTCEIVRRGKLIHEVLGLNEVAILGGPPYSIVEIELYVDEELATTYSCDGLIISTPVGSTAHNLSAGGPILRKNLQAFVISAISPHTLTVRPVVDSADRTYQMVVPQPNDATSVVVDGQVIGEVTTDDRIRVKRAPYTFRMIEVSGNNYYRTLREKLGWSGRIPAVRKSFDNP
jgi:NAD+ kinase